MLGSGDSVNKTDKISLSAQGLPSSKQSQIDTQITRTIVSKREHYVPRGSDSYWADQSTHGRNKPHEGLKEREFLAERKTHAAPRDENELGWRATQKGVERALQVSDVRGI